MFKTFVSLLYGHASYMYFKIFEPWAISVGYFVPLTFTLSYNFALYLHNCIWCTLLCIFLSVIDLHLLLLLLLLLPLQPTVGFNLLSDFLPFRPFLTQLSPPSYSHYMYIFFDVLNPSFPWSSSVSPTSWFPLQYSFRYSFPFHPHHMTQPSHSFIFYKSHSICVYLLGRSARNSFWFSRIHLYFALDQRFFLNILRSNILRYCSSQFVSPYFTSVSHYRSY